MAFFVTSPLSDSLSDCDQFAIAHHFPHHFVHHSVESGHRTRPISSGHVPITHMSLPLIIHLQQLGSVCRGLNSSIHDSHNVKFANRDSNILSRGQNEKRILNNFFLREISLSLKMKCVVSQVCVY